MKRKSRRHSKEGSKEHCKMRTRKDADSDGEWKWKSLCLLARASALRLAFSRYRMWALYVCTCTWNHINIQNKLVSGPWRLPHWSFYRCNIIFKIHFLNWEAQTNRKDNALFNQTNLTLIVEHSGLALSHGRTICYQIKFNHSDLRTQICCSHVHELSCWRHSVENSMAREFACSGGANQLSNFCNKLRSKLFNFKFVGPLSFRSNMQHHENFDVGRDSAAG